MLRVISLSLLCLTAFACTPASPEDHFWTACKKAALFKLKAPRTAIFADRPEINLIVKSGKALIISGIDAQNSFGALIRSEFQCMRGFGRPENEEITVVFKNREALRPGGDQKEFIIQTAAIVFMTEVFKEHRQGQEEKLRAGRQPPPTPEISPRR